MIRSGGEKVCPALWPASTSCLHLNMIVFRNRERALLEHRPNFVREPFVQLGPSSCVREQFYAEADFCKRDGAYVKPFQRLGAMNVNTLGSGFRRRGSESTLVSSSIRSQRHIAHGHGCTLRYDIGISVWRRLQGFDECSARLVAFETAKLLGGDNDHFVAPMHGDVLRSFAADLAHQLAEPRLGILQKPMARRRLR